MACDSGQIANDKKVKRLTNGIFMLVDKVFESPFRPCCGFIFAALALFILENEDGLMDKRYQECG